MRVKLVIDSATTAQARALQQAYHAVMKDQDSPPLYDFGTQIPMAVNGPDHWKAETPMVSEEQAKAIARKLWPCGTVVTGEHL